MPAVATLIDNGPLVSILGKNDPLSGKCSEAFKQCPAPLLTCWPVITETAYLLGESSPGMKKLFELLHTNALAILPLHSSDLPTIERSHEVPRPTIPTCRCVLDVPCRTGRSSPKC